MKRFTMPSLAGTAEAGAVTAVALGRRPADLAVTNASVFNVYTGECLEGLTVAVLGPWIAYVGDEPGERIGPATRVVDGRGRTLIPGLIEGHTHLADMIVRPSDFIRHAVPGGTTTVITETIEPYPICGRRGIEEVLAALANQAVTVFATAPPLASNLRACNGIVLEDLRALLDRDDVLGLGETYWSSLLQAPDVLLPRIRATLRAGGKVEGHTAGASGDKLMACAALGLSSCHEAIRPEEALERLRLGFHVMIREGSIRRDLEAVSGIRHAGVDLRRVILVTDGIDPGDLLKGRGMDTLVQKAVDCGFEPAQAIRMATLNPAEYFGLDGLVGGVAPGRQADLVLIPELGTIRAELVVAKGRVVAENGRLLEEPREHVFSEAARTSIRLPREPRPEDFVIRAPEGAREVPVRVIDQVTNLVTREHIATVSVTGGEIRSDVDRDLLKIAALDRAVAPGKRFVGLIRGLGLRSGAFACSCGWDAPDMLVAGVTDADMALAVQRIRALQGGIVVTDQGRVRAELPLPVFGYVSDRPLAEAAGGLQAVEAAVQALGCPFESPHTTLATLSGPAIPFLRICSDGLVDLKTGARLDLFPPHEFRGHHTK